MREREGEIAGIITRERRKEWQKRGAVDSERARETEREREKERRVGRF